VWLYRMRWPPNWLYKMPENLDWAQMLNSNIKGTYYEYNVV
jgi:hypothetical protein